MRRWGGEGGDGGGGGVCLDWICCLFYKKGKGKGGKEGNVKMPPDRHWLPHLFLQPSENSPPKTYRVTLFYTIDGDSTHEFPTFQAMKRFLEGELTEENLGPRIEFHQEEVRMTDKKDDGRVDSKTWAKSQDKNEITHFLSGLDQHSTNVVISKIDYDHGI